MGNMSDSPIQRFVVASANFGGGARVVPAAGGGTMDRAKAVADFIAAPSGDSAIDALPLVAACQEMSRLLKPPLDYPAMIARRFAQAGRPLDGYFIPTVTTELYPLSKKWQTLWDAGIQEIEQGMWTCARDARLLAPWLDGPRDSRFKGRKLDLPVRGSLAHGGAADSPAVEDRAQGAYYQGNRDTEPRVATAHGVCVTAEQISQFVFINVHLTTLEAERADSLRLAPGDRAERSARRPHPEAARLRAVQLGVIRDFILEVAYAELKLPVIVAGDFNAGVEAPEVISFMADTFLTPVFGPDPGQCWQCAAQQPRGATPLAYFTHPKSKEILAKTPREVALLTGMPDAPACPLSAVECCAKCQAPFFTHKRNFGLLDNILFTDAAKLAKLKWKLAPALDPQRPTRGIRLDSYFSDHLPVWCQFAIQPS